MVPTNRYIGRQANHGANGPTAGIVGVWQRKSQKIPPMALWEAAPVTPELSRLASTVLPTYPAATAISLSLLLRTPQLSDAVIY